MPAVMDDPTSPTIYRVSGQPPFPDPSNPGLPDDIVPRQVTLRDRQTVATIVPFVSRHQLPASLLVYLCDQLNREIEGGDTYPMMEPFTVDGFADYWFQTFGAVMLMGNIDSAEDVMNSKDWAKECLGSFFIKPNYPGRSSHICNASFITTDASRNRGVGRLMGEAYIDWAPRLGYTYSVFNLVYETNVASCRIWDALGFKRIGRIKACGNLRSHPDRLIDAIIYGRDLAPGESEELVSEERFDKIRFYLKYGKYPNGADRAEKSRLRSAATHYKLLEGDKLMLKDKEVISDPARQYEIARNVHAIHHGGINKTTATIAEKFHWSRIKETVSDVIRACVECKELGKTPNPGGNRKNGSASTPTSSTVSAGLNGNETQRQAQSPIQQQDDDVNSGRVLTLQQNHAGLMEALSQPDSSSSPSAYANPSDISVLATTHQNNQILHDPHSHAQHPHHNEHHNPHHHQHHHHNPMLQDQPASHETYQPIDPQIINHHDHQHPSSTQDDIPFDHYHPHADFQALLNATEDVVPGQDSDAAAAEAAAAAAVDRDLEMLIEHDEVDCNDGAMEGLEEGRRIGHRDRLYDVGFDGG
ncbi:L-azetidine-2-carboxylic acid acetyltransferase [Pochonia chlamydosporia 170]|uniref:L-azetidine-2-carboxylic acid acetyltransferase n=1 Tax=Pochonia chlamydosporia 170 TaxID=1380566 RepID=A0A179FMS4_METCM|nr:L-azetidine-2-carboxylic acid acetyltransferase [Pochonia chlamydosporia 170]OAQ66550.1 L-azetidine-2-carboxylic acid acetyltransferase [Pochonia chlamydosporia 170]